MEKNIAITGLMIRHHAALDVMLELFKEKSEKETALAKKYFEDFKWELEKHIFAEERVIFKLCKYIDSKECKTVINLTEEHKKSLVILSKIEKDLASEEISNLRALLIRHRKVEEEILYPKLDSILNEGQKELVFQRINEISRLGEL
jgi:iron-sulfur cluster repair protein YtfE (RIC family)